MAVLEGFVLITSAGMFVTRSGSHTHTGHRITYGHTDDINNAYVFGSVHLRNMPVVLPDVGTTRRMPARVTRKVELLP